MDLEAFLGNDIYGHPEDKKSDMQRIGANAKVLEDFANQGKLREGQCN